MGARLQAAFSRALEGQALAAAGERLEAVAALRDAEHELDACGSTRVRDEMRRELRRLGARAEPRGPAAPGESGVASLSKRELEIAQLATDRLTNREIAAALFLSDKTIESHLRNIFHKLGVTSRVEVARAVEEERRGLRARDTASRASGPRRGAPRGARLQTGVGARAPLFDNAAMGFAAISPVVGLYAVVLVGTVVAGPAWVWVLPVALIGQCLLLAVYAELASQFPIAGGAYQWSRRLMATRTAGSAAGWRSAPTVANTTVAYLGAPWALTLARRRADADAIVVDGRSSSLVCAFVGAPGIDVLGPRDQGRDRGRGGRIGRHRARAAARLPQPGRLDRSRNTLGAEQLSGGSVGAGMLAAPAVARLGLHRLRRLRGRVGGDRRAARHVPRAIWIALLSVGALVILNAFAVGARAPRSRPGSSPGEDLDPVTTAVVASFGSWSAKPFAAVVLVAFLACGMAAQALTARDDVLGRPRRRAPGLALPAHASTARRRPSARSRDAVVACLGLLLGSHSAAVGSLIAFGTAAIYVAFLIVAFAALSRAFAGPGTLRPRAARPGRRHRERPGGGVAGVRDRQHRVAPDVARPARCARLSGVGGTARPRPDRHRRGQLPRRRKAAPQARRPLSSFDSPSGISDQGAIEEP